MSRKKYHKRISSKASDGEEMRDILENLGFEVGSTKDGIYYRINLPKDWTDKEHGLPYSRSFYDSNGMVVLQEYYDKRYKKIFLRIVSESVVQKSGLHM